ncbi:hypothetical protein [Helicobacter salomonis]|uniref:hypothetical protein n=1 Tax=Helicobacter salomonis TaxID=56878 RepID=UPI000CF0BFDD|nr:hypothetical protein [Helicobacter salomonis]
MMGLSAILFLFALASLCLWLYQKLTKWTSKGAKTGRFKGTGWGALGLFVTSFLVYQFGVSDKQKGEMSTKRAEKQVAQVKTQEESKPEQPPPRKVEDKLLHLDVEPSKLAFVMGKDNDFLQSTFSKSDLFLWSKYLDSKYDSTNFAECVRLKAFSKEFWHKGKGDRNGSMDIVPIENSCLEEFERGNPLKQLYKDTQLILNQFIMLWKWVKSKDDEAWIVRTGYYVLGPNSVRLLLVWKGWWRNELDKHGVSVVFKNGSRDLSSFEFGDGVLDKYKEF